ncbi:MAG: response regulator [Alphaproteobacteria bacterium]
MAGTKKILIIEDNADWRELLVIFLRKLGYEVIAAETGEDGVAQAFAMRPDLVLMDLGLPRMSGDQATAHLKANPTTKDIPVIVQTAFGMGISAERAMEAGALEILHKPITMTEIESVLCKYLSSAETPARGQ